MSNESWTPDFGSLSEAAPTWPAKRPRRIALLGDFSGGALRGRIETGADLLARKPLKVEFDTLDDAVRRLGVNIALPIGNGGESVDVPIDELEAFHPDALYANLPLFSALTALRKRVNNPATFQSAAKEIQSWGGEAGELASRIAHRRSARGATPSARGKLSDFARLTERHQDEPPQASSVDQLLRRLVGPLVVPADSQDKGKLLELVDAAIGESMRAVLHQPDFQNTEALWRGVDFLLRKVETGSQLEVHLIDISAEELAADLSGVSDLSESGLYQALVSRASESVDGGYTWVAGLYHFEATPPHAELLGRMAQVAAHAGAPFITGLQVDAFANRREPPNRLIADAFAALRELPAASFLALLAPRFMLRYPYGKRTEPISSFAFEEFSLQGGLRSLLWGHPALIALSVLAVADGQLTLTDLPFHTFKDRDGDPVVLPCCDRMFNVNQAALLREYGINAVMAHKGEGAVHVAGLQAVNGDALTATGRSKASADNRFAIGSSSSQVATGRPQPASPVTPKPATDNRSPVPSKSGVDDPLDDETADAGEAVTETESVDPATTEAAPVDDELAALLASLDDGSGEAAGPAGDAGEPGQAPGAAAEEAMDPELAALLASLD